MVMGLKIWSQVGELDYHFQIYRFHMSFEKSCQK